MANWMWYPGDFEIYHGMIQNFDREERGYFWPAYWKIDDCRHSVKFSRTYKLDQEEKIMVTAQGIGYVAIRWKVPEKIEMYDPYDEIKYALGKEIICPAKEIVIEIVVGNRTGLPCVYVAGKTIQSGKDWLVTDFSMDNVLAGYNDMYTQISQNPMEFEYSSKICLAQKEYLDDGILYDFKTELTAKTVISFDNQIEPMTLCYGESREEALDIEKCYQKHILDITNNNSTFGTNIDDKTYITKIRAFRYIFVPDATKDSKFDIQANHLYIDFPKRSHFESDNERLNKIWEVSENTFRLASGIFFIDGIKRDRWIWSGDAFQSYFINKYIFADKEINKRTILALRGNDPVIQHINTILDYSLYWIISIEEHYKTYGDLEFIKMIYPKMKSMMDYCLNQINENGFIYGRKNDWVFIDWAYIEQGDDKINSAEQFLLARSYQAIIMISEVLGVNGDNYKLKYQKLIKNIKKFFWDEQLGAYIDSYTTGNRHVSRHANIFAIVFDFTTAQENESILNNVLLNDQVAPITTPYFKFYELEAYSKLGYYQKVMDTMDEYWGGMLERGATTFWEEYNENDSIEQQYDMYGDKYGKSLCHAWGATPIYLIGRYLMGIRAEDVCYETFMIEPQLNLFNQFDCEFPLNDNTIKLSYQNNKLTIWTDKAGGKLKLNNQIYKLEKNMKQEFIVSR